MASMLQVLLLLIIIYFLQRWSICLILAYHLSALLCSASDGTKRKIISVHVFRYLPFFKNIALKLFNPEYNEVKQVSGKHFCCECGDQPVAPGVNPKPSDQGNLDNCTLHAIAKAIVSFLDKKNIDVKQDDVEQNLLTCVGTTKRLWPSSFHKKELKIHGVDKTSGGGMDNDLQLIVDQVASTNQIPSEKNEYVLCTSYLSPSDLHTLYIEKKEEKTGKLFCINSWGSVAPRPVVFIGDSSNIIYKIEINQLRGFFPHKSQGDAQVLHDLTTFNHSKLNSTRKLKAKKGKCKRVYKKIVHHYGRRRMSRQFDSTDFLKMERKKLRTGRSKIGPTDVRKLTTLMEEISCKLDGCHGAKENTFTHLEESSAKSILSSASCRKKPKVRGQ